MMSAEYVVALHNRLTEAELERYCYSGQAVYSGPVETKRGKAFIVRSKGEYLTGQLVDRLSSGLIGAMAFSDLNEAEDYIDNYLNA